MIRDLSSVPPAILKDFYDLTMVKKNDSLARSSNHDRLPFEKWW